MWLVVWLVDRLAYLTPNKPAYTHTHERKQVGVKYAQLLGTVGIHPTCAEELVGALPSKSSGASAAKAGC